MNAFRGARRSITWKATASTAAVLMGLTLSTAPPASAAAPSDPAVLGSAAAPVVAPATNPAPVAPNTGRSNGEGSFDAQWGDRASMQSFKAATVAGPWDPSTDLGSLATITQETGARQAWADGITGEGVTVAVIDTGIGDVKGLDDKGKIVNGPDLSFDSQRPGTRYVDGYGHGTHMAAIIAGRDGKVDKKLKSKDFYGIAPDAQLLNMKVGSGDGGVDVTQVIAALDWVVQHKADHGMNVRVVNLAYGTESVQGWDSDPLARAVDNAWKNGLVVVTAAGNDGAGRRLLMPAADPNVIAVGAVDHLRTPDQSDDVVADFTNTGTDRAPDVLAPGTSVVSLRVPGSFIDQVHPEGMVDGDKADRFFRGSGTSQATAVVSGEVALLLQKYPKLAPDQVKAVLQSSATPLSTSAIPGVGVANVTNALKQLKIAGYDKATTLAPITEDLGTLDGSRGGEYVIDPMNGGMLEGEFDALGSAWKGAAWLTASTAGTAWTGGTWNGRAWTGDHWTKDGWAAVEWTGDSWSSVPWAEHLWSTARWTARSWRDDGWNARSWRDDAWNARSWRDDAWLARSWRNDAWRARSWRTDDWLARSWRAATWEARSWRSIP